MKLITELELKEHFVTKHLLRYGMTHKEIEQLTYREKIHKLATVRAMEVNIETESNRYF